jgi:Uma2 family endonuclease
MLCDWYDARIMRTALAPNGQTAIDLNQPYAGQPLSDIGDPAWELALAWPRQGDWSEADYLKLERHGIPVELVEGRLEFLPMPTLRHQRIMFYLCELMNRLLRAAGRPAEAVPAPCPLRLWPGHLREPDVFIVEGRETLDPDGPQESSPFVVEIVSPGTGNRKRDLVDKRRDYAKTGIREYWVVDPQAETITVLALDGHEYRVHGEFKSGETAISVWLPGFAVEVAAVFAAGRGEG